MLDPRQRVLLLESLRPPLGYSLDRAVGTTYSLDLLALLTAPLAFTVFDWEDKEGRPTADPLALLEALRRSADRVVLFCQAGQIKVPPREQRLLAYLEQSVVEVRAPQQGGVFHPKVWVLRFIAPDAPIRYRLLCLSRNLTFDRSWDVALSLDGELIDRQRAFAANRPLADFVSALPDLAVRRPILARIRDTVAQLQDELLRVRFELPDDIDAVAFWSLGLPGGSQWPFRDRIDRLLVISPFLSASCLVRLAVPGSDHVLVSTDQALSTLPRESLQGFSKIYVLNEHATAEPQDADSSELAPEAGSDSGQSDLHAKVYVADAGRSSRVWIGSANATVAAFERNVELLVELNGKKSRWGVDAFLTSDGEGQGFIGLLDPYIPPDQPTVPDPDEERLQRLLDEARWALAAAPLRAHVAPEAEGQRYLLTVEGEPDCLPTIPDGMVARCWPVTLRQEAAVPIVAVPPAQRVADFGLVSFEALTSFFAFELAIAREGTIRTTQFVLNLPLVGVPADRYQRVLLSLLDDGEKLMRFLMLLLAGNSFDALEALSAGSAVGGAAGPSWSEPALLESLMRALDRNPEKLDQIAGLVGDVRATAEGRRLLPDGFDSVWDAIWTSRQRIRR